MSKNKTGITFDEVLELLKTYITNEDELALIHSAYLYTREKHLGEKRLTGDDYMNHPLNVAYILADMKADYQTICAGLLHDILENPENSREELLEKFGEEVVKLVDGITMINRLSFSGDNESKLASQRKILVGLTEDVRVIFIKLADRLHNMRTLWAINSKAQREKAKETLDILTPIAARLGMNHIKGELEDLCLRYMKPDVYFSIVESLNETKIERDQTVEKMIAEVNDILNNNQIEHHIKGRSKSIYSIYKKMDKGKKFSDIYDLLAMRIYVNTESECYQALGLIHAKFKPMPKRFKDYIANPKPNMYQSLHTTVFGVDGKLFEIQIRTYEMDAIAENGIASHWSYKEKGSTVRATIQNTMEQKLQFFKTIMDLKHDEATEEDFVNSVKSDILKESIYVFTPKGDAIELPNGSTPIDFAYRVHSKVGDSMIGAIVNNQIVPLDYVLQDNDIVNIKTNKNTIPSKEWINIAYTQQAKNKIRGFFNRIDKEEYLKKGEEEVKTELRKRKISFNDFFTSENTEKILSEMKCANMEELYINIGNGKTTATLALNIAQNDNDTKEEIILKKVTEREVRPVSIKDDIVVEGIDSIKVNVASCCQPIPGDNIVGYITKGNGISVHRMSCPNVENLEERMLSVHWNDSVSKKYHTSLLI
ncbi:MAG: bifunctional (p)ppGpp synthetase/guanosine-3',5'-bis(diphosphate) 3'-pyrophosphohydrolase, partial [Firmicutes bacterium]|nr:bifunctional (p)ppGpp synthetase/guanosine-3',5'-bis(diphosphate) 3'-pyrophosphohydrolase [Bacillota bacterium]